jgi:prepilin-type processing-associated H-X9-DG protein
MLLPALGKARSKAKTTSCLSQLKQTGTGVSIYSCDNDGFMVPNFLQSHSYKTYVLGQDGKYRNLGELFNQKYISNPKIFYCPGSSKDDMPSKSAHYKYHPEDWTRPYSSSYTLLNTYIYYLRTGSDHGKDGWGESSGPGQYVNQRFTKLKSKAYLSDAFHDTSYWNHPASSVNIGSINVVFGDGHAKTISFTGNPYVILKGWNAEDTYDNVFDFFDR